MARRGAAWALGLALLATCGGGRARAADPAPRKPSAPTLRGVKPAPLAPPAGGQAAVASVGGPSAGPDVARARIAPLPGADRLHVGPTPGGAPTLRSAVRSRWSASAVIASRGGGACRAQCAASRVSCVAQAVDQDAPRCDSAWTGCLSTCAGLTYGRAAVTP